jgi:uncharacterized membrane protein YgcG
MARRALGSRRLVVGLGILTSLAGCSSGDEGARASNPSGPSSTLTLPLTASGELLSFRIRPLTREVAGRTLRYQITATASDPDNDLIGGRAVVAVPGLPSRPIATAPGSADAALTPGQILASVPIDQRVLSGTRLRVTVALSGVPLGRTDLEFFVIDASGTESNRVPFVIRVRRAPPRSPAPGSAAPPPSPTPAPTPSPAPSPTGGDPPGPSGDAGGGAGSGGGSGGSGGGSAGAGGTGGASGVLGLPPPPP